MCGRYFIKLDESEIARKVMKRLQQLNITDFATEEVFPSQKAIVLFPRKNGIDVDVKKWGIEKEILAYCYRKHKKMNGRLWAD